MPKIVFIDSDGSKKEVNAPVGVSLLKLARDLDLDVEGACGGSLACATCHMILTKEWYDKLGEPSEDEEDMLDLAFGLTKTSRLGCQIKVREDMDGMVVTVPPSE